MTIKNTKNTLSLGLENGPKCLSGTEPETYSVITWAVNMTPSPTVESVYKICGTADELRHLDQRGVKGAIAKALDQKKAEKNEQGKELKPQHGKIIRGGEDGAC